jgi:hypothetical protein
VALAVFGPADWRWATSATAIATGIGTLSLLAARAAWNWRPEMQLAATMALPFARIAATLGCGWLVARFVAAGAERGFWTALLIAYIVTLLMESAVLVGWVRRRSPQAASSNEAGG